VTPHFDRSRVGAICFDIDGTLADTDDAYVRRLARTLRPITYVARGTDPNKLARTLVMAAETPINTMIGFFDRLALDQVLGPLINLLHHLRGESEPNQMKLIPGTREALDILVAHYPLAIITAREERSTKSFLSSNQLENYFACVASARTCRRGKPHPAPVRWAAEQLGIPVHACIMVGDTTVDIRSGVSAGAQTVGVLSGFGEREELVQAGANLILNNVGELVDLLLEP
jgi:HAD superfamily hydrolase (TIGR01509 family)